MATIKNLDEVKAWLAPIKTGDEVNVSTTLFDALMVNELFGMFPDPALTVKVTAVGAVGDSPSLSGVATVMDQPLTNTIFTFTQPKDTLLLHLNLNLPQDVTWNLLSAFSIGFTKLQGKMSPDPEQETISLGFACDVVAGSPKPVHLPVNMMIPTFDGDWTLSGSFDEFGDLTYDVLNALSGNNNITSILPKEIADQINKFSLKEFQLSFNPLHQSCSFIRIVLQYSADWHFFGDLFVVENLQFQYEIFNPLTENYYQATLLANMNLFEGFPFQVGGQFPDKTIFAQLQPDRPAELTKVFNFLKIPLPENFPDVQISTLSLVYYTADGGYDFKLAITKPIPIAGSVSLSNGSFEIGADYDANTKKMIGYGSLHAHFTIDTTTILLSADYKEGAGVDLSGEVDNLHIGQLIVELVTTFGITEYPKFIEGITLTKLKVTYNTTSGDFTFLCIGHIPMADNPGVDIELSLTAIKSRTADRYNTDIKAQGKVTYNKQIFTLLFSKTATDTSFAAQWENKGTPLGINMIADMLGIGDEVPQIPEDLDLDLKAAAFIYDSAKSQPLFILEAASENYGNAVFSAIQDLTSKKWLFYFGMATNAVIELSNLPIIDKLTFITEGVLAIQAIHADVASGPISKENATLINSIINKYAPGDIKFPNIPSSGMVSRVAFSMQVNIGGTIIPISLGAEEGTQIFTQSQQTLLVGSDYRDLYPIIQTINSDNGGSKTFWFNLEKNFGPLYFEKIGLAYKDSKIFVLVNVAATAGGLTIALDGFGVSLPIKDFDVSFTISGISIAYQSGPILISGGLMGTFSPVNLVGQVYIKNNVITIVGLGGYTEVEGHPSLFIYAVLNYPLGGPPYFFVTGLAAGFGFNRSLVIPGINGVATFPFVEWAMGLNNPPSSKASDNIADQINTVLQTIMDKGIVAPTVGSNWLAAGLRFTSFEILDSFALLTVAFGNNFEIALLGLSRLVLPPGAGLAGSKIPVIVYAELALVASFSTETGLIAVQGQLTNSSYVFSKDCHLTGGFAFYIWVSGEHLGEFVVTLGGYNPNYQPPTYYPVVPRLGMNWKVTDNLSIKGGEYFALTSNAVMAGGYLDAVWQSGGIKAWFSVQADFLIMWRPFYYDIRAGVSIGASFTIDLWFTTLSMSIHVGASLHIWGPEFSGIATVDLSIISFTISFGAASEVKNKTISWNEFAKDMLPQKNTASRKLRTMYLEEAENSEPDPDVCKIIISNGLITQLSEIPGELNWIVDGEKFSLTTQSTIPSKDYQLVGKIEADKDHENYTVEPNTDFGIRPTGTAASGLTSVQIITITSDENSSFKAQKTLGKVAKGLWQPVPFDKNGNPILGNPVSNTTLDGVLTGFTIVPYVAPPKHTLPITLSNLQYTLAPEFQYFMWSDTYVATNDDFQGQTVQETIMSPLASGNRSLLLAAILENGPTVDTNINVALLANPATNYLLAEPVMRLLGEEK